MRCKWLFTQRCLSFAEEGRIHEKIPNLGTHPDFFVDAPGIGSFLVVVEVESFIHPVKGQGIPTGFAQVSFKAPIKRMQVAIQNGARQLKPYAGLNLPLVVVLDNHRCCNIPSNVEFLRDAAFGQTQFRADWDPIRGELGELQIHHGAGQVLSFSRKTYISAVMWNIPKVSFAYVETDDEVPMRAVVVLNHFAKVPLPCGIFCDPDDRAYGYDDNGCWSRRQEL